MQVEIVTCPACAKEGRYPKNFQYVDSKPDDWARFIVPKLNRGEPCPICGSVLQPKSERDLAARPDETPAQKKARKLACALRTLALYHDDIVESFVQLGGSEESLAILKETLKAEVTLEIRSTRSFR